MVASKYAKCELMKRESYTTCECLPAHGLGLSVDVYSPDLMHLVQSLRDTQLEPGYLEVFKATTSALRWVRQQLPDIKLPYHGEGLWTTQPDFPLSSSGRQGVAGSLCANHGLAQRLAECECATKQMAGYTLVPICRRCIRSCPRE